jgi:UTP--glucose-1-phosphate uridylyltransferase
VLGENATAGLISTYELTGHAVMAAQEVQPERKSLYGILETDYRNGAHYIQRVLEKPAFGETSSNLASFGRYLVTRPILELLREAPPGRDGEIWFTDAVISYIAGGGQACVFRPSLGTWYTVGDPQGFSDAVVAAVRMDCSDSTKSVGDANSEPSTDRLDVRGEPTIELQPSL